MPPATVVPYTDQSKSSSGVIECISYNGLVPRKEANLYVQFASLGDGPASLAGGLMTDVSPVLTFLGYDMNPGGKVRVYTTENPPEWGGFAFGSTESPKRQHYSIREG